ncbi:putative esterase [Phaeomoniella chlamydospora]|uniref:Putative esterase n=1 Tax=Phaeomoniella chlamydospora TaxID=158046 RepID=A0A0G2EPC4_PHACM|nr:putative esterase [Phaeomoniella chlamydospora]
MVDNVNSIARTTGSNPMPPWKEAVGYTYVKDKFEAAGLTQQPSDFIHPPRILECPIQMEAEFVESNDIMSDLPDRKSIVLKMEVKILRTHVEESLRLNGHPNRIDTNKLRPLFMVFQEFHGMTRRISGKSRLAEVNEENYRLSTRSEVTKQLGDDDHLLSMVREDAVAPEGTAVELTHEQKESLRHLDMPTDPSHQGVPASNPSHNAIPPSLASRFDPVYLSLYNKYNVGKLATHQIPIETYRQDPAKYTITYGRAKGPEVYKTVDLRCSVDGGEITVRVYLPGPVEEKERGAYINFHGGGWVFGGLANAEETLKRMVMEVGCVAFDVDYRLAPEFRYPAAVEDCWSAFQWILKTQITPFNIDTTRLAVGGDSAGGHLAAVISILARDSNLPLSFQLLTVPVADLLASFNEDGSLNENTPYFSYKEMKDTQPLSVERMQYFHEKFLGLPRRKEYENVG